MFGSKQSPPAAGLQPLSLRSSSTCCSQLARQPSSAPAQCARQTQPRPGSMFGLGLLAAGWSLSRPCQHRRCRLGPWRSLSAPNARAMRRRLRRRPRRRPHLRVQCYQVPSARAGKARRRPRPSQCRRRHRQRRHRPVSSNHLRAPSRHGHRLYTSLVLPGMATSGMGMGPHSSCLGTSDSCELIAISQLTDCPV